MAGYRKGFEDAKGRGTILMHYIVNYIDTKSPKVFVLENVEAFTQPGGGKYAKHVVQTLEDIKENTPQQKRTREMTTSAYAIHDKVITTSDHGVPYNRQIWYCIGFYALLIQEERTYASRRYF